MNRREGFTLIELLITITVMVILVVLSVIILRTTQATARDEERKTDVENIARGLELRYNNGNPKAVSTWIQKGAYPGVYEMQHGMGVSRADFTPVQISGGYLTDLLPETSQANFVPPSGGTFDISCVSACQPAETQSFIDSVTTTSKYVYEPIDSSNNVCMGGDCVRFNLYYRTEQGNTLQKVKSKHQ